MMGTRILMRWRKPMILWFRVTSDKCFACPD
jgi:hypothetical protein